MEKLKAGKAYHHATGYNRYRMQGHFLDWKNQPLVYKTYPDSGAVPLPDVPPARKTPLGVLFTRNRQPRPDDKIDITQLSRILMQSYIHTAKSRQAGQEFYYRSAASAGALYPCELYLAAPDVGDLENGIYHYQLRNRKLVPLRSGNFTNFTGAVCSATGSISFCFYITGIFFRSAWKYRKRAFRYVLLDAGHLLENLLLALRSVGLVFSVHYDFTDRDLECLLGIDGKREGILACVTVHGNPHGADNDTGNIAPLSKKIIDASRVSDGEVCYGEIETFYRATASLPDRSRESARLNESFAKLVDRWMDIESGNPGEDDISYPDALFLRRSKRNYVDSPLSRDQFMQLMDLVCAAASRDPSPGHRYASAVVNGFVCGNVEGITPGFYLLDPARRKFGRVFRGDLISKMASACLDQEWLRSAAVHFLFLTNLAEIDRAWGPRSYRYAMLAAGRTGQAIYLGATAQGLGACGIGALYDAEIREILGLTEEAALLYLMAVGPVKKRDVLIPPKAG